MNCDEILISVVVPVYNVEKYLSVCIDNILAQSTKTWRFSLWTKV